MASAKVGILAGGGDLPLHLARAAQAAGRELYVVALQGEADTARYGDLPHGSVDPVKAGRIVDCLRAQGCGEVVLAGQVSRPNFDRLRPDWLGVRLLARVLVAARRGDDAMLGVFLRFFEDQGFRVVGVDQVAGELLAPSGVLGRCWPSAADRRDIEGAVRQVASLETSDAAQAAVVRDGQVLAVEGAAGTDDMLASVARIGEPARGQPSEQRGVLVKMTRSSQDRRVDLPTIGLTTVLGVRAAGLAGIAVEAGGALILDRQAVIAAADDAGMFLCGIAPDGQI
jgi:hypothetical protein